MKPAPFQYERPETIEGVLTVLQQYGEDSKILAGGQSLIALAFRHLPVSFASVTMLANPVLVAILGWAILGEALAPLQGLGCAGVLAGIALAQRLGRVGAAA